MLLGIGSSRNQYRLRTEAGRKNVKGKPKRRWSEVHVLSAGDGWVVRHVGRSAVPGETDRVTEYECGTVDEVFSALEAPLGFTTETARRALNAAAKVDERLVPLMSRL